VDKAGDVFITEQNLSDVVEYAHGGTKVIATLKDPNYTPWSCSVDSVTGNLAVANLASGVAIFTKAKGKAKVYTAQDVGFYYCGYDNRGNLFADGESGGSSVLDELPKGGTNFEGITLGVSGLLGGVQWDGKYVAVGNGGPTGMTIYQFKVTGTKGTEEHSTTLKGSDTSIFWVDGSAVAALNDEANIGLWKYPGGGWPTKTIYEGMLFPTGVTISPASHK
jgi:hypothetical protein